MADSKKTDISAGVEDSEISQTLAEQDAMGHSTAPEVNKEAETALDALAAAVLKPSDEPEVVAPADVADPEVAVKAEAEAKAKAEAEAKAKAEAEEKAKAEAPEAEAAAKLFEGVDLPPQARPKSAEAFATVKARAAAEISRLMREVATLTGQVAEAKTVAEKPLPEEVSKELETLREFRAKYDVEADPSFAKFDETVANLNDAAYAYLLKNKVASAETIEKIKKLGGLAGIEADAFLSTVKDANARRFLESKFNAIEEAKLNREQAIEKAKSKALEFTNGRREELTNSSRISTEKARESLTGLLSQLPWFTESTPKADATEEDKKAAKEHGEFLGQVKAQVADAIADDSPEMRAILVAGFAQLLHTQRERTAMAGKLEAAEKQVAELTEKLGRFTKAATPRLRQSAAPPVSGGLPKKDDTLSMSGAEALDAIAAKIIAEKNGQ